jgi:hypothetical protein
MDTLEFARTGEPWIKEFRSDDGKTTFRMSYDSDDPAMRFFENIKMLAVGALGIWLAGEWRFSIRDVLVFGTACAIGLAAPNPGVWMLIVFCFAIYLWRTTARSVEV